MKVAIGEIAKEYGLHPGQLLIFASKLGMPFDECYPEVETGWADTISLTFGLKKLSTATERPNVPHVQHQEPIWTSERKILHKLHSEGFWGSRSIGLDTLHAHQCRGLENFDKAIASLLSRELILVDRKAVSLNSQKRGAIYGELSLKT